MKNLQLQGIALRVRRECLRRTEPNKPWQGLHFLSDDIATEFFDSLVEIRLGDVKKVLISCGHWINGYRAEESAPMVVQLVRKRAFNNHSVADAITNVRWVVDIWAQLCPQGLD